MKPKLNFNPLLFFSSFEFIYKIWFIRDYFWWSPKEQTLWSILITCFKCLYSQLFLIVFIRVLIRMVILNSQCLFLVEFSCESNLFGLYNHKIDYDQDVNNWFNWKSTDFLLKSKLKLILVHYSTDFEWKSSTMVKDWLWTDEEHWLLNNEHKYHRPLLLWSLE